MVTTASPVSGADARHVQRMARAGGLSLAGAGVSAVAGVALTAMITNGFDQKTAGTIFATTSLFIIATAVVQLGTDIGLVRWLPALMVRGERDQLRPVLRVALLPVVAASLATGVAGYLLAPRLADVIASGADHTERVAQIRVLAAFLPVAAVYNVLLAATRGMRTMVPTVATESFGRSLVQLLMVAVVQVAGLGAVAVVVAWSLPYAVGLAVVVMWFAALLRTRGRARPPSETADVQAGGYAGAFWRYTTPRAIGTASQMALKRADIVLVAALRSPSEAALYAAATRFVVLGQLGVQALQQALSPQLSALFAQEDHRSARDVYRATTAWAMLLAWPTYLACAVMAPDLLRVFGDGYDEVAPVVVMLSIAMLAATASGAVDTVLLMSGHSWLSLGNNLSALVLNLALNVVLIPKFGAVGAGVAWTISIVVRNLLPMIQIAWKYHISPIGRETALVAVTSVLTIGVVPFVLRIGGIATPWVLGALLVGSAAFLRVTWRLRDQLQLDAFEHVFRRSSHRARHARGSQRRGGRT
jgi:O-antigen/teichoic acid export membrane protein